MGVYVHTQALLQKKDTISTNIDCPHEKLDNLATECYNYQLGLLSIPQSQYDFLWVDSFPLFTREKESNTLSSTHHPFTAPCPEDLELLNSDPEKVKNFLDTFSLDAENWL